MKAIALTVIALSVTVASAHAEATVAQKRKLYALADAGPAYCPEIKAPWYVLGSIHYNMSSDDAEYGRYKAEFDDWLRTFRSVGNRAVVCQMLMDTYGPGTKLELFQYR